MSNPYGGAPNGFNQQAYQFYQQPVQQFQVFQDRRLGDAAQGQVALVSCDLVIK